MTTTELDVGTRAPTFDYESISSSYYDLVFRRGTGIQSKWHHLKFARIRAEMKCYETHLDIGCGPGTFIGTLSSDSLSIGLDITSTQIAYAQCMYGTPKHQFRCVEPGLLPFEQNSFDVVTIIEVVEHLSEDENNYLMQEVYRVLRRTGFVLVSTPNYASLWPLIELVVNKLGEVSYAHQHITHFNRFRLRKLLKRTGFINVTVDSYLLASPFFASFNWRLSDIVSKLEPKFLVSALGLLLLGKGKKSE